MPTYREQLPTGSIASWVECAWCLESRTAINQHRVAPDGCLDVIYDRGRSLRVVGTMTVEQRFDIHKGAQLIGIRFRPGMARPFLGISAAELTDTMVELEDLWPHRAGELRRQLDDSKSAHDAMQIMLGSLRPSAEGADTVQKSIEALVAAHGSADLDTWARQANLSPRQFRRRCLEETGLSPKLLCRILRFRHASQSAFATERPDWSSIAADAGYFDQAHLIRDFRGFTGLTPMSVFSNTQAGRLD